jgi:hypothetical protein
MVVPLCVSATAARRIFDIVQAPFMFAPNG